MLSKQAVKIVKRAEEHESFINKVGLFCLISDSCFFSYGFIFHHLRPLGYGNIEQALIFLFISVNVQVTHLLGVLGFGGFCFLFGASKFILIEQCSGFCFSFSLLRRFNASLLVFIFYHPLLPGPEAVPLVYCVFYVVFVPLRWIYYRFKKWHYYLLVNDDISYSLCNHETSEVLTTQLFDILC